MTGLYLIRMRRIRECRYTEDPTLGSSKKRKTIVTGQRPDMQQYNGSIVALQPIVGLMLDIRFEDSSTYRILDD